MEKRDPKKQSNLFLNEEGMNQVSDQIMDVYNSGVIDQSNANFDLDSNDAPVEGENQQF
ncbi:hypothetical protein KHA94_15510 [Bacillus sp. FJAT-49705]|uniref:DUF4025 domain-containing protein n=1 Tax=Cytobacillus citreus TaxID=2833586 RepID=A0ABS5NUU3_9BACI|nr:hypothetical protein [Cytobacillus citreus]MBS4191597.1 hypothetical protein [Cytobacillus citreus]